MCQGQSGIFVLRTWMPVCFRGVSSRGSPFHLEHVPTKLHDVVDWDMLQIIELPRLPFSEVNLLRPEALGQDVFFRQS